MLEEPHPPVVQTPVAEVAARPSRGGSLLPPAVHHGADPVAGSVMPGCFDEQPAGVTIAGLGDRTLHAGLAGGELAGHQPDERADAVPAEPVPVADLDRQGEPGQRTHPTQTAQPAHERGELAVCGEPLDRPVEPVPAGLDLQHRLILRIERALRRREFRGWLRALPPLTELESLLFRSITVGFVLLTATLLTGLLFVDDLLAQHLVHKTVLSVLSWLAFGALLLGRWQRGWRGATAVRWTLAAMALLVLAFFGSKFVLELVLHRTG